MWKPVDREDGITIPWRKIVLHAIQNMNNQQTVYAMINFHLIWPGFYQPEREANGHNGAGDAGDDANDDDDDDEMVMEEEDEKLTELRFVPGSQELVNQIYEAMNQCQRLNPDSAANSDDEYFSGEEDEACFDGEEEDDDDEGARDMNNLNLRGKNVWCFKCLTDVLIM